MEGEYACDACYMRHSGELNQTPPQASSSQGSSSDLIEIDEQSSCLRFSSVSKDEHHCIICGIACRTRVLRTAAVDVYMKRKLFVSEGIRCCASHLTSDNKHNSSLIENIQRSSDVQLEGEDVQSFLDEICEVTQGQILDLVFWPSH
jgi:hypothetical protein